MSYSQLRIHIRNVMVGLSIAEAMDYRESQLAMIATGIIRSDKRIGYIDEFIRELEDEWDDLWRCPVCKEVVGVDFEYNDIPYCGECDCQRDRFDPVEVIFLRDGDVFAVLPSIDASTIDATHITCYAHVGQHCCGTLRYCDECEEVTDPAEYADLAAELDRIGYNVRVISKEQYIAGV